MLSTLICSPLTPGCRIDWEAWAAIGTVAAVVIALIESFSSRHQAQASQRGRARWIALQLLQPVDEWHARLSALTKLFVEDEAVSLYEELSGHDHSANLLQIPETIKAYYPQMAELGAPAEPMSLAIYHVGMAQKLRWRAAESLRGDIAGSEARRALYDFKRHAMQGAMWAGRARPLLRAHFEERPSLRWLARDRIVRSKYAWSQIARKIDSGWR